MRTRQYVILLTCGSWLLACGGSKKSPSADAGGTGGVTVESDGGAGTGGRGTGGAGAGGRGGQASGVDAGATGGFSFTFDGSLAGLDAAGLTCADLLACCNSLGDVTLKAVCLSEYNQNKGQGDSVCGTALAVLRQAGTCH
jgi:hypothetical protein